MMHTKQMRPLAVLSALLLGVPLAVSAQDTTLPAGALAGGLNNPRGIAFHEGSLYIAEAGTGGDTPIDGQFGPAVFGGSAQITRVGTDMTNTVIVPGLPSRDEGGEVTGASAIEFHDGLMWVATGQGPHSNPFTYAVVALDESNRVVHFIDTYATEVELNPDGENIDSNPVDLAFDANGRLLIADAGANAVWQWTEADGISLFKAWDDNPVPTTVALDPDGNIYISFLTGFPFAPGSSRIEEYSADGELINTLPGLTTVVNLVWNEGLYAVEFGQFGDQGWTPNTGRVVMVAADGAITPVAEGLNLPYGLALNDEGGLVVGVNSAYTGPGSGAVIDLSASDLGEMPGSDAAPTEEPTPETTPGA